MKAKLVYSKIPEYLELGKEDKHWYRDTKKIFEELFPSFDTKLVINVFAACSINTSIEANVSLALKALYQHRHGQPFEGYLKNIKLYLDYAVNDIRFPGRKIRNYTNALNGDPSAVVVDLWMTRAFGFERQKYRESLGRTHTISPRTSEYDAVEKYIWKKSKQLGLEPREMQAMIWAGIREKYSKNNNSTYEQLLRSRLEGTLFPIF